MILRHPHAPRGAAPQPSLDHPNICISVYAIVTYASVCCTLFPRPQLAGDDAAKTSRLAAMLSRLLEESEDAGLSGAAAHTLGHLVRSGGAMTSDILEKEVRPTRGWVGSGSEVPWQLYCSVVQ